MPKRIPPKLPVTAVKTFTLAAPLSTHWRNTTCEEVDCPDYLNGWITFADEATPTGHAHAHYIRHDRTRRHTESRDEAGITQFLFGPGQMCFKMPPTGTGHGKRLDRPEIYIERDGDWRGNPTGLRIVHTGAGPWVDSFGEHQDQLADKASQG